MTQLIIASPNYSSWSLRAWFLLQASAIPFDTVCLSLADLVAFKKAIAPYSQAGRVPVLIHDDLHVWDSLAIVETLHEHFPEAGIYPKSPALRALSRSMCAEMHSGFMALRQALPMNIRLTTPPLVLARPIRQDIARILELWQNAMKRRDAGEFLFGKFSAVDAFFAPVVFRFNTYGVAVPNEIARYMQAILNHPAAKIWVAMGKNDARIEEEELYPATRG